MPIDNVVPIDAEAARLLARREVRFRWFVAGLAAAWLAALIPVVTLTPLPPLAPFLVLGALVVFAEHRFVLFGDETSMSASIVVIVASVFVFADSAPLAGPMLVGSLGGLYLPHLRHRRFGLLSTNTAALGLAALCAAMVTHGVGWNHSGSLWLGLAAGCACLTAYWCVDSALIGLASGLRNGTAVPGAVTAQVSSESLALVLALGTCLLMQSRIGSGRIDAMLLVTLPLAAFEIRIRGTNRGAQPPTPMPLCIPLIIGLSLTFASVTGGHLGTAILAIGTFLFLSQCGNAPRQRAACIGAACTSGAALFGLDALGVPIALQAASAVAVSAALLDGSMIHRRASTLRVRLDALSRLGALIPSRREAALVMVVALITHLALTGTFIEPALAFTALAALATYASSDLTRPSDAARFRDSTVRCAHRGEG